MSTHETGPTRVSDDAALSAIVSGPRAWTPAARLEKRYGVRALAGLVAAGWLATWATDRTGRKLRARSLTLTPWAAERMGLVLDELPDPDGCGVPVWVRAGAESTAVAVRQCARHLGAPHLIPDPRDARATRYALDEDDEPIVLFGMPLPIDPRLMKRRPKGRAKPPRPHVR